MSRFDLVIFDCDGLLIDSETLAASALAEAVTCAGLAMTTAGAEDLFSGASAAQTSACLARMGLVPEIVLSDTARRLSALFAEDVPVMPGMKPLLNGLGARICVASNSGVDRLAESLGRTPLAALFGVDVYSADHVARGKPAPDLALHCLAKTGIAADRAIFVDDNVHGIACARGAGILAIGFVGPSERRRDHAETLRSAGADHVVHGVSELRVLLGDLLGGPLDGLLGSGAADAAQ